MKRTVQVEGAGEGTMQLHKEAQEDTQGIHFCGSRVTDDSWD